MKRIIYPILVFLLAGCQTFVEPEPENFFTDAQIAANPALMEGVLLRSYTGLPNTVRFTSDMASDDAVSNDPASTSLQMATGSWSTRFSPVTAWSDAYSNIFFINYFLEKYQSVKWATSVVADSLYRRRLKGEAHGLRAWYEFQLLQRHAGEGTNGQLLGFPIVTQTQAPTDNVQPKRNTFEESVTQILADCDIAINNLPAIYADKAITETDYNSTTGARYYNRLTAYAARAIKARTLLYAASPAYNTTGKYTYEQAAKDAGDLIILLGGINGLPATGNKFYSFLVDKDNKETIWGNSKVGRRDWEEEHFPPSLFGKGRLNPTQEFINSFPMANGYPINHPQSGYVATDPYKLRDRRLADYVVTDGSLLKGTAINTYIGAPQDGIGSVQTSTRTGYYLRKFMDESVNLTTGSQTSKERGFTLLRQTEVFLNYAEAANEAYGPDADPATAGLTARTVIAAIRKRAGIPVTDLYLKSLTTKEQFRELIRTERRLELCFEEHRFWDLRRWKETSQLTTPVSGVFITPTPKTFTVKQIETRAYTDFMIYGPIPLDELQKNPQLIQNKGW